MSDSHTPGDFFVEGTPHITPDHMLDVRARQLGFARDALRLPPTCVATFFPQTARELALAVGLDPTPVDTDQGNWRLAANDQIAVGRLPMGVPHAASLFEQMVSAGTERLIIVGAAGSLQPTIEVGHLVIPTDIIREEGTSYHYLPADEPARADADLAAQLSDAVSAEGQEPHRGLHWTTDAIFREQEEKIVDFRSRGMLSVDMEISVLYAVAPCISASPARPSLASPTCSTPPRAGGCSARPRVSSTLVLPPLAAGRAAGPIPAVRARTPSPSALPSVPR
jgi:hypothetical protein